MIASFVAIFRAATGFFLVCIATFLLGSCAVVKPVVPPAKLEYFQSKDSLFPANIQTIAPHVSRIQVGDILGIIISSLNKDLNEIMNAYNISSLPVASFTPGGASSGASGQPLGYPVDSLGYVSIPLLGKQKLDGLTIPQAEEKIRVEVGKTIKSPAVSIRFVNHKFTVLGEVSRVGTFNLLNDHTTIIEAITAAGDLTIFGKRDSVKVIRSVANRREIGLVSLRNRDVFSSPYFYVQNDDIIYVEPTKQKTIPESQPPQKQPSLFVQRAPFYLTFVTTLVTVVYLFSR
ncbi:polysaccharide biosynthesis/export family protein [Spirosoma oryzicola]|uniref:polysaccharide biosynthesis/export family protein n=1 Tax=Spirosoma oryzicola TaxID=2898794 RepID=UPI001E41830E|nr:polysaccharide biosynthesis/export family protein [Spirosoma oryzicola]UHG94055.1 polysaccharide biosynthesis/export family protein [Spirosoma oryzicola]